MGKPALRFVARTVLVFLCGAFYEASCIGFIHYSERGHPLATALFSMLGAAAEITGVFEAVHDWRHAPAFVLGYGVGTYLAVTWKVT